MDCYYFVNLYGFLFVFFFFKQKTAYEMRISDWSSDVCSSDLNASASSKRRSSSKCLNSEMSSSVDEISSARNHCRSSKFLAMHLLSHHPMDRRYEMCEAGGALYHNLVSAMEIGRAHV